jgi:hypothetical protein
MFSAKIGMQFHDSNLRTFNDLRLLITTVRSVARIAFGKCPRAKIYLPSRTFEAVTEHTTIHAEVAPDASLI